MPTVGGDPVRERLAGYTVALRAKGAIRSQAVQRAFASIRRDRCITGFHTPDGMVTCPRTASRQPRSWTASTVTRRCSPISTSGCPMQAWIQMDGSVHVAGDPALLEETAQILREWETLGRPSLQDWRCAFAETGPASAPILTPRGWSRVREASTAGRLARRPEQ